MLATIDIPLLNSCTYKQREREVGRAVEYIAKTSCQDSLNRERAQALLNGCQPDDNNLVSIPCLFDMGWQKHGKGHNSRTGHAAAMSLATGKVLWMNSSIPSLLLPLWQNESLCETIGMKI